MTVTKDEVEKDKGPKKPPDTDAILGCLEDILSKANLAVDSFIQQHMNAQLFVSVDILATHRRLTSLECSVDGPSIIAAAKKSEKLGVAEDDSKICPKFKPRRNTLILHDLPENLPEEELKAVFDKSPDGASLLSLRPDVNHTAYVTFKTDEDAQNVALWLRSQKLRGAEIRCSVKAEHFVRSFFPGAPASPMVPYATGPGGYAQWGQRVGNGWNAANDGAKGDGKGKDTKSKGEGRGSNPNTPELRPRVGSENSQSQRAKSVADESDDNPAGYSTTFRKYSPEEIIDICNAMTEANNFKPESYKKAEKDNREIGLFRQTACKEWVPPPTPGLYVMRNSEDWSEAARKGSGPSRKNSWSAKGGRTESGDTDGFDMWDFSGAGWRSKSRTQSGGDWSWDENSRNWDGGQAQNSRKVRASSSDKGVTKSGQTTKWMPKNSSGEDTAGS